MAAQRIWRVRANVNCGWVGEQERLRLCAFSSHASRRRRSMRRSAPLVCISSHASPGRAFVRRFAHSQYFVALVVHTRVRATFVPYSQHFVARISAGTIAATKYCLDPVGFVARIDPRAARVTKPTPEDGFVAGIAPQPVIATKPTPRAPPPYPASS
jgi:hypothetical protein